MDSRGLEGAPIGAFTRHVFLRKSSPLQPSNIVFDRYRDRYQAGYLPLSWYPAPVPMSLTTFWDRILLEIWADLT
jgi:hypothetical protein